MFRFTIRDLVLLTLVVAMGVGWWADHAALYHKMTGIMRHYDSAAARLNKAQDLLEFQGVIMSDGETIYTTLEHAAQLRKRAAEGSYR